MRMFVRVDRRAKTHVMLSTRMMTVSDNAPSVVQDSHQTQMDAMAKDVVKRFFSLDTTRPLGIQAWFLNLLVLAPEHRAQRLCFMAEMMALTCGLMLFFMNELVLIDKKKNARSMALASSNLATLGVMVTITCLFKFTLIAMFCGVRNTTVTTVVLGGAQAFGPAFFGTVIAMQLMYLSFVLKVVDQMGQDQGGGPAIAIGCFAIFLFVYFPMYAGHHFDTTVPLSAYHQTKVYKELQKSTYVAAWLRMRRPLKDRAKEQLEEYLRVLPEDVRQILLEKVQDPESK